MTKQSCQTPPVVPPSLEDEYNDKVDIIEDMSQDLFDDDCPEDITIFPDSWQIPESDNEEDYELTDDEDDQSVSIFTDNY